MRLRNVGRGTRRLLWFPFRVIASAMAWVGCRVTSVEERRLQSECRNFRDVVVPDLRNEVEVLKHQVDMHAAVMAREWARVESETASMVKQKAQG